MKRSTTAFSKTFKLRMLRAYMQWLGRLLPAQGARKGLALFLTPPRYTPSAAEHAALAQAARREVPFRGERLPVWQWGSSPDKVLLVHGWGGRGGQLHSLVPALLAAGMEVHAFDGPAHGLSDKKQTTMVEFADAIVSVAQSIGALHAIVGHSFGAACSALALSYGLRARHAVLIGCPSDATIVIERFAKTAGIHPALLARMRHLLRKQHHYRWRWEDFAIASLLKKSSVQHTLLVHDVQDKEVPYADAGNILQSGTKLSLLTTDGLGHRRVLKHPMVIERIATLLTPVPGALDRESNEVSPAGKSTSPFNRKTEKKTQFG